MSRTLGSRQTSTKPDNVRHCPRSRSGQTRTHPYRGVRCPEDDVVKEVCLGDVRARLQGMKSGTFVYEDMPWLRRGIRRSGRIALCWSAPNEPV